jgi:O-antigen/teichoic acid export membrane protein
VSERGGDGDSELDEEARREPADAQLRRGISGLFSDAAFYGSTRVLLKSLAFLLVPLYAAFLTPTEFGVLELVLAVALLVDVVIAANMDGVFARFYFDEEGSDWRRKIITIYLLVETIYPIAVIGLLIGFSDYLSERIFGTEVYATLLVIALIDVFLTNIVDLPMTLTRLRRKRKTFAAYSLARGFTQIVLSVLLVAVWQLGVKGILIASLAAVCLAFVYTSREWIRDLTPKVDWATTREMISFAWPGIIGGLAFYALNLADRFVIKHFHGVADTGLYGVAFRYSQIVIVAVFAFRLGWAPWHYPWLNTDRHQHMVARGATYYFFAIGFLVVFVSMWIYPLFRVILPEDFWDAAKAVPPLALAAMATGAHRILKIGMAVKKRMRLMAPLAVIAAGIAFGLYFLLIPPYSFVGAAWATVGALAVFALMVGFVGQRLYPVPWDWYRIGLAVGGAVGLALAALAIDAWVDMLISLPVRLALTVAFPATLFLLGFFPTSDLFAARAILLRGARAIRSRLG